MQGLTGSPIPPPALRTALEGWLGYIDAAILDWIAHRDLDRVQLRDLLLAALMGAILGARQVDPALALPGLDG